MLIYLFYALAVGSCNEPSHIIVPNKKIKLSTFSKSILHTIYGEQQRQQHIIQIDNRLTIEVNDCSVNFYDFDLTLDKKNKLVLSGWNSTFNSLENRTIGIPEELIFTTVDQLESPRRKRCSIL